MDNTNKPLVTPLVLTETIKAKFIDVENLAADEAFINRLEVKKLAATTGTIGGININEQSIECIDPDTEEIKFKLDSEGQLIAKNANITGTINADGGSITGDLNIDGGTLYNRNYQYVTRIGGDYIEFLDEQPVTQNHGVRNCKINLVDGIKTTYSYVGNSGLTTRTSTFDSSLLTLSEDMNARSTYNDIYGSHYSSGGNLTTVVRPNSLDVTTPTAEMSAVLTLKQGGCNYIMVVTQEQFSELSPISTALYIVTDGADKGV